MAKVAIVRRSGWWATRTLREKRLLLFMTALLALVLIWFVIIRPLLDARAAAEQRLNAAVTELARARAEVAALSQQAASSSGSPVGGPLDAFLMQSAGEQGFTALQAVANGPGECRSRFRRRGRPPSSDGSGNWKRAASRSRR
jgi:general secretion pathway protein M